MRIAHIITRMMIGGAQENTLYNCRDLIELCGDEVLLITGPETGPEGDLLSQNRGTAVPTQYLPELRRDIHPWHDAAAYFALKRTLREFRPQVVHTHSAKGGLLGRFAAAALGVPAIIHTVHGAPFYPYQAWATRRFYQSCERAAARRCHRLISVAHAMTDLLVQARVAPREKFTTVYSGMEVEPFLAANEQRSEVRRALGYTSEQVVIGKIARLFSLKGHDDLISAAPRVLEQAPHVRFLLVGDGILRASLERQIAAANLTQYFHFVGLVDPVEIPRYLGAFDVLVHTSLREGLARALPQALIAGKPVVSYDIDGAREVCLPGETGYLIPPREIETLASGLIALATNAQQREEFGARGRALFTEQFRHETMSRRIRTIYEEVLNTSNSEMG